MYGPTVKPVREGLSQFNTVQLCTMLESGKIDRHELVTDIARLPDSIEKIFVHSPVNGCYASNKNDYLCKRSQIAIADIMKVNRVDGVVLHYGSHGNDKLRDFFDDRRMHDKRLLIENSAGQGNTMGVTIDDLRRFHEEFDKCGMCIDTQHSFASGLIDLRDESIMLEVLDQIGAIHKIDLIHLNDSTVEYGKRVDSHADLGRGNIWKRDVTPLKHLVDYMKDHSIPFVTETNDPIGDCHFITDLIRYDS